MISAEDNIGQDVADADAAKGTARVYTGEVKNLVQALYGYYVAAEAYAN